MGYSVRLTGPMFDGRSHAIVAAYRREAVKAIAEQGDNLVHQRLHQVLQHPTGWYESHIRTDMQGDNAKISDGGQIVYGPWLEGVGSRNAPVTRFRGYFTFRLVSQMLQAKAEGIARAHLNPTIVRLNG